MLISLGTIIITSFTNFEETGYLDCLLSIFLPDNEQAVKYNGVIFW